MTDEELRAQIAEAHREDAPPPFATIVGRAPADGRGGSVRAGSARRRRFALVLVPLLAAAAILLLLLRPHAPPPPPSLTVELHDPLAFLLVPPGDDVLRTVPQFDTGGDLP